MTKKEYWHIEGVTSHTLHEMQVILTDRVCDLMEDYPDLIPCGGPAATADAILNGGIKRDKPYYADGEPEHEMVFEKVKAFVESWGTKNTDTKTILQVFYKTWEQQLIERYIKNTTK